MKSRTYTLIVSGVLATSALAFGACSSGSESSPTDDGTDQVASALDPITPFQCRQAIRQCVDTSCQSEIKDLLTSLPFTPRSIRAVIDLQQCAFSKCNNACSGGLGGAPGA